MSIEAEDDIHRWMEKLQDAWRWTQVWKLHVQKEMEKYSYKMNEDEHKLWWCVEKESEDEIKCKVVVKMNMSCKDAVCIKNEVYE